MSIFGAWKKNWVLRGRRKATHALAIQAAAAIGAGRRFGVHTKRFTDDDHIREFLVRISREIGDNVRASSFEGMLVVYLDDGSPEKLAIEMAGE